MPRRFFRKFAMKRDDVAGHWFLRPIEHLLHDQRLWGIRRKTVVPAFAIGLFAIWVPFPAHLLIGVVGALLFRVNIPVAAATTFINNPFTIGPMFLLAYGLGALLLGQEGESPEIAMSLDWVTHTFLGIWEPMLLGCLILAIASSAVGYVVLDLIWRSSIADYKKRKQSERN